MTDFERWHEVPEAVRLVRLRDLLATGQPWTYRQVADRLGISVRQAQRDVLAVDALLLGLTRTKGHNGEAFYQQSPDPRPHGGEASQQRRRAQRLMALRNLLDTGVAVRTREISESFGVTLRTAERDLLDMDTCLMPLHHRGYFWRKATF